MDRENSKKHVSFSKSDESDDERDQKPESTSLAKEFDQPSTSDLTRANKITSSKQKPETSSPIASICEDGKQQRKLSLSKSELISISNTIAQTNNRYLRQLEERNRKKQLFEASKPRRCQEGAQRRQVAEDAQRRQVAEDAQRRQVAEARQHAELEQKDSVLAKSGDALNLAVLRGVKGDKEKCDKEAEEQSKILNLHRSRILLGLITKKFLDLQELRFNAEVLMQFLEERRSMLGDGRRKFKDPCSSPSIPKFNLRPIVKGLDYAMDKLHSVLEKFIRSTKDLVQKYRLKSPELDVNAFRDYTNQFFDLQERLEQLEGVLKARQEDFVDRFQIHKEILELLKQSRILQTLLTTSYFKFGEILYQYGKCISQNPVL